MSDFNLTTNIEKYRDTLEKICKETVDHLMEVEGRPSLSAFADIYEIIPELPKHFPVKCHAFIYKGEAVGYAWVVEDTERELYYILGFYVAESSRRHKFGTEAIRALDEIYKDYNTSELLVSAKNYIGLNFWVYNGYSEITCVIPPEEQGTVSTELNLRRHIKRQ
jgi:GNAT superfamily N-acetyltransferase